MTTVPLGCRELRWGTPYAALAQNLVQLYARWPLGIADRSSYAATHPSSAGRWKMACAKRTTASANLVAPSLGRPKVWLMGLQPWIKSTLPGSYTANQHLEDDGSQSNLVSSQSAGLAAVPLAPVACTSSGSGELEKCLALATLVFDTTPFDLVFFSLRSTLVADGRCTTLSSRHSTFQVAGTAMVTPHLKPGGGSDEGLCISITLHFTTEWERCLQISTSLQNVTALSMHNNHVRYACLKIY